MADERISKLQKWILTTCYRKTIERDNNGLTILERFQDKSTGELKAEPGIYWDYLFRDEILSDYYKYPADKKGRAWHDRKLQVFTGDTAAGRIATDRSLASLDEKGLIEVYVNVMYGGWKGAKLTEAGIAKALLLTSV